jgi:hypothetical protein
MMRKHYKDAVKVDGSLEVRRPSGGHTSDFLRRSPNV